MTGWWLARRVIGTALIAATSLLLVSCARSGGTDGSVRAGSSSQPTPSGVSSTTGSATPAPGSGLPSGASGGPRVLPHALVVQGRVVAGVEAGCRLLVSGGRDYLLVGVPSLPEVGTVVRVQGHVVQRLSSYCMQGTPLRVDSMRVLSASTP